MKLTKRAIKELESRQRRLALALALGFTEQWIDRVIEKNKSNGPLTTAKAIQTIETETGLTSEQILEEEKETVK